jgi:hypothetical protein
MEPNYHPKASNFSTVELLTKLLAVYIRFTITSLPALNWSHSSAEMHLPLPPPFQSSNPIPNALLTHRPQLHLSTSSGNEHQGEAGALGANEPTNCTTPSGDRLRRGEPKPTSRERGNTQTYKTEAS